MELQLRKKKDYKLDSGKANSNIMVGVRSFVVIIVVVVYNEKKKPK